MSKPIKLVEGGEYVVHYRKFNSRFIGLYKTRSFGVGMSEQWWYDGASGQWVCHANAGDAILGPIPATTGEPKP